MRRREFLIALGGVAIAVPFRALAQPSSLPIVGILDDSGSRWLTPFRQGLSESGLVEGQDIRIDLRSTEKYAELAHLVDDLVQHRPTVIAALGGVPAEAAKTATGTIPVVFVVGGDPVQLGLVPSLNRPGGNVTGTTIFASQLLQKQVGILHDLVPKSDRIGLLVNPDNPRHTSDISDVQEAARTLSLKIQIAMAGNRRDLDAAFADFTRHSVSVALIAGDAFFSVARKEIVALAADHGISMIYNLRDYVLAGGLVSYGPDVSDVCRQAGVYAARIVKGEKPADLPVLQPTKFDFAINLKTAKALGLSIPSTLLATADEVIE